MKNTFWGMVAFLVASSSFANTLHFSCNYIDEIHVNRFNATVEVRYLSETAAMNEATGSEEYAIDGMSIAGTSVERGLNKEPRSIGLEINKGTVEFISSQNTISPYTFVKVIDKERNLKIWLAVDFPGELNSKMQLADGRTYRSTCKSF